MSLVTDSKRRGANVVEQLLQALTDPTRREKNVGLALLAYIALWTLYAALAKGSQDIHDDMSEEFALGHDLAFGYAKHPPLAVLIVRLWFSLFPATDWAFYLLAMVNVGATLWIIWRLCERFVDSDKSVLGVALLTLVPFFSFHALKFNANTILMPLWAGTTFAFLRSFETRRVLPAAVAGLCAAAAMYAKYWSVFLLLGLALAAMVDPRRRIYFCSPAPWVTVVVGAAAIAPHLIWLIANDFAPFSYAMHVRGDAASSGMGALTYLVGSIAYVSVPLLVVFILARPGRAALADMAWPKTWPKTPQRRLAAAAFWAPLLLPALVAPLAGVQLTSLWSMSAWTLLPVMLLSSPLVTIARVDAARALAAAALFPVVMVVASPTIGFILHREDLVPDGHSSLLAQPVERLWHKTTNRPLQQFASVDPFTYGVPFYLRDHPRPLQILLGPATAEDEKKIERDGVALLCPASVDYCLAGANARAAGNPNSRRTEIEVARRYLGVDGTPARYVIIAIPPK